MILASSSKARLSLMKKYYKDVKVLISDTKETFEKDKSVEENIINVAKEKVNYIIDKYNIKDDILIGADTVVVLENKIITKPKDRLDALNTIKSYENKKQEVITGVYIVFVKDGKRKEKSFYEKSYINYGKMPTNIIEKYLDENEYLHVAGGLMIEIAKKYFDFNFEGDIDNIKGIPINTVRKYVAEL